MKLDRIGPAHEYIDDFSAGSQSYSKITVSSLSRDRQIYWIAMHCLFWAGCAWLRLPYSYWDDSLIIGPAIGLADGFGLRNIYLSNEFYPPTTYLFYPPTFSWILAGWITAFGRGVGSLSSFWAICGLGISLPVGALLRRLGRHGAAYAVAPALVFGCIAYTGYRYEILGLAAFFSGLALCAADRRLAGYSLLCLTPTIAPTMVGGCAVAIGALVLHHRGDRQWRDIRWVALALVIAISWLWVSVAGDIPGLIETMFRYRSVRIGLGGRAAEGGALIFLLQINMLTAFIAHFVLRHAWRDSPVQIPLLLVATRLLTLLTHARPTILIALNVASLVLLALALAAVAVARMPARFAGASRHASGAALAGVGIVLASLNIGYAMTIPPGALTPAAIAEARAIAAQAKPDQTIVADVRVMRDALNFPSGRPIEDAMIRHAWPAIYQDYHHISGKELWIVTPATLAGGGAVPLTRGVFDALFISPGMAALPNDGICRLDATVSRQWRGNNRADLIALACR